MYVMLLPEPDTAPAETDQVTAAFDAFATVALKLWDPPALTDADVGVIETLTAELEVTLTVAVA